MMAVGAGIHLDRRIAKSGVTPALPLMKRENWTRDTPSCLAACVTVRPSSGRTSSFRMLPGCGGLCICIVMLLVIVLIIDQDNVLPIKCECQSPVSIDPHGPMSFQICAMQWVQSPAWNIHLL